MPAEAESEPPAPPPSQDPQWLPPGASAPPPERLELEEVVAEPAEGSTDCQLLGDETVLYELGKVAIKPKSLQVLDTLAEQLKRHPDWRVEVGVHTDSAGSSRFNAGLSKKRARLVVDALIGRGIDPSRLKGVGYGEERPIMPNDTAQHRAMNRRTEFQRLDGPCASQPPSPPTTPFP